MRTALGATIVAAFMVGVSGDTHYEARTRILPTAGAPAAQKVTGAGTTAAPSKIAPLSLKGPFGEKTTEPPEIVAKNFLKSRHRLFSLKSDLSDVTFNRSSKSSAANHVTFQQSCDGIPVEGGKVSVHLLKDGRVQAVKSRVSPGLRPDTHSSISEAEAMDIARQHLRVTGALRGPIEAEKVVLPHPRPGILAWKVTIPARRPCGDWVVMVHAQTWTVISVRDIRLFATGQGKVFDPNPVVTLRRTDLSDQGDSASAVPLTAYSLISLENLDGTGYLRGPFVDTGLTSPRAYSAELNFSYDRANPAFEEVMIYYHVQEFQRYLQNDLGFSLDTRQVLADAHAGSEDNAWYSPLTRAILFGDGGVDDAEDAYAILHEYAHTVAFDIVREPSMNTECSAMDEGAADYLAASFFADRGFEPETFAHWDGVANIPIGVRRVDSDKVYPADVVGEGHDDGEIWSSALWRLRSELGREVTDKLVVESVFYLDGSSQFSDGLEALILADEALYAGAHADAISSVFAAKGIARQSVMKIGDAVGGMLAAGDLVMKDGSYYDQYSFMGVEGQTIAIAMTAKDFDAYLVLLDPFFNTLAHGDDLADGSTNARIVLTIPYSGAYHILANVLGQGAGGGYSLSVSAGSASDPSPQTTFIAYGREVSGHLGSGDLTLGDDTYYDDYVFAGHVGQKITASMSSANMDAYLVLYDADDNIMAQDDDSGPGTDALLSYTLPYDGEFTLAANQGAISSGDYTFLLNSSDPQLSIGQIVSGTLEKGDLTMTSDGSYFDPYQFEGTVGQRLSLKMYSYQFDPYLIVYNPYYEPMTDIDDISSRNTNAFQEELELNVPGTYFLIANAFGAGETGAYRLAASPFSTTDTDSDGYPDRVELSESTDPLNTSSIPPDVDGDFSPDTMDTDNDNDQMPNLWEIAAGLNPLDASDAPSDADSDGMPNLSEFIAGTDPRDPASKFRVLSLSPGPAGLTLRWKSVPGRHYAVHRSAALPVWSIAESDVASQGDETAWTGFAPASGSAMFYRVEAVPQAP